MLLQSRRWMSQRRIAVIVTDTLTGVGEKGEVVNVRPGFARNHLFPKKMAVYATDVNRIKFEEFTKVTPFSRARCGAAGACPCDDSSRLRRI